MRATDAEVTAAFDAWLEDYEANPDDYYENHRDGEPPSYGVQCLAHLKEFIKAAREVE